MKFTDCRNSLVSIVILALSLSGAGCGGHNQRHRQRESIAVTENAEPTEIPEPGQAAEPAKTVFAVLECTDLYSQPAVGEKVLNQTSTDLLGEITYCSISPSTTVRILEDRGDWVKVQVVTPDWLTSTHIGWVESSVIDKGDTPELELVEGTDYTILLIERNSNVTNYYVKNITCALTQRDLLKFAKALRSKLNAPCNIYIYEDDSVVDLMTKYPLYGAEYIKVADKLACELSFDDLFLFYPLQDIQYKEFGGRNWKTRPIE